MELKDYQVWLLKSGKWVEEELTKAVNRKAILARHYACLGQQKNGCVKVRLL